MSGQALKSAALAIAAKSKPVFPCNIKKHPLTEHGYLDATTDTDIINEMFSRSGVAGIGMPTGPVSGLLVIDRDRKNGVDGIAACKDLEADLGPLPETLQQRTGSGGDQLFFTYPAGAEIPCSAGKIGPGIDVRSAGGYVIIPPSRNEAGAYAWLNRLQPAPLPQAWIDRLAKTPKAEQPKPCPTITATLSTPYGAAAIEKECRELAAMLPDTGRNARLNQAAFAAGQLVAGGELVESEALTALEQAAAACGLDEIETQKTIRSGFDAGMAEPRQAPRESSQPLKKGGAGGADGASPSGPGVKPCPTTENGSGASGAAGPKSGAAMPKGYFVNAAGLHYLDDSNPDKEPVPYRLGPVIEVLGWTRNTESREWGLLLRWRDPDGVVHEWAMPASLLFDRAGGWVAELVRGGWIPEPGQKQRAWLAAFFSKSNPPARVRCVTSSGWYRNCFVMMDHVYGLAGAEPIVMQSAMSANPYQQTGAMAGWQDTIGKWSVGNSRLTLAVCLALSGPLLAKAGMGPGGVNMFGTSSTGKSTCLLAGLSVWGGPDAKASWNATKNGLEGALEIHNDTFYALDEMSEAPGKSMSELVYMLGNGAGRARAHQDGSARRVRKWRCAVFSTGEIRVEDKLKAEGQQCRAGHGVRLLELPADAGAGLGCWEDLHGHATGAEFSQSITDAVSDHHGHAGRAFVQGLIDREQDLTIATDLDAITTAWTPEGASGQVVRCVRRFALMAVAGELATALEVTPWTPGHAMQMVKRCLDDWLQARGTTGDMEHGQAVKLVLGYLARYGQARFENLDTPEPGRIIDRSGFKRTSTGGRVQFVFLPDQLAAVVPGLNITQAVKSLDQAGLLRRNDKHLSQKITLPELGRLRCYVIEPPDLEGGDVC